MPGAGGGVVVSWCCPGWPCVFGAVLPGYPRGKRAPIRLRRAMSPSRKNFKKGIKLEKYLLTREISRDIIRVQTKKEVLEMKANEILKEILTETGKTKAELGRAVGIEEKKASDLINKRMKQENISVNVMIEMLNAMGYTMVVVPTGAKMKDGYEVTK